MCIFSGFIARKKNVTSGTVNDSAQPQSSDMDGATNQVHSQVLEPVMELSGTNENEETLQALKTKKAYATRKGKATTTSRKETHGVEEATGDLRDILNSKKGTSHAITTDAAATEQAAKAESLKSQTAILLQILQNNQALRAIGE